MVFINEIHGFVYECVVLLFVWGTGWARVR